MAKARMGRATFRPPLMAELTGNPRTEDLGAASGSLDLCYGGIDGEKSKWVFPMMPGDVKFDCYRVISLTVVPDRVAQTSTRIQQEVRTAYLPFSLGHLPCQTHRVDYSGPSPA